MKRFLSLFLLVLLAVPARVDAQSVDDQYVRIYNLVQEADAFNSSVQSSQALAKYLEAQGALQKFQKINPDWNPAVVKFRLAYLSGRVSEISAIVPTPAVGPAKPSPAPGAPARPATAAVAGELETQLSTLRDQVRQMQAERMVLEAKL